MSSLSNQNGITLDGRQIGPLPGIHADFDWGAQTPGAAHVALALLREVVTEQQARQLQFVFAAEIIANLPRDRSPLSLASRFVEAWARCKLSGRSYPICLNDHF